MEESLHRFIQDLLTQLGISIQEPASLEEFAVVDGGLRREILGLSDEEHFSKIRDLIQRFEEKTLYHLVDVFQCNYYMGKIEENTYRVIGPIIFERITNERFDELFRRLKLPEQLRIPLQNYYFSVTYLPFEATFDSMLNLILDYQYGKGAYRIVYVDENRMSQQMKFYNGYFRVPEEPFKNIQFIEERYGYENALILAVCDGNEQTALEQHGKLSAAMLPQRLTNELRDQKDLTITTNTLLRKAAEQGGVHPIHIDSLSNNNIKQIEMFTSIEECKSFQRKMVRGYCRLVREFNLQTFSLPIRRVVTYINSDLTADLSLKALAEQLNVNSSYLSGLFKKEMGMPLTEYVNTARVSRAQVLLYTTDLPIKNIALQCGISDMYYFSRMFKRISGVTPTVYREMNHPLLK